MAKKNINDHDIQDKLAGKYQEFIDKDFYLAYQSYWNNLILDPLPLDPKYSVLDCGCGIGKMLEALSLHYDSVYGIDISSNMVEAARSNRENVFLSISDAQDIAFKDDTFDIVICRGSLHHCKEPVAAIKEIYRVLKKGGFLVFSEPCRDNILWRKIGITYVRSSKKFVDHHHLFYSKQIEEMIVNNGFKIIKDQYFGFIGFLLCGVTHQFPLMRYIPFRHFLSRLLIKIDKVFAQLPIIRQLRWHIIVHCVKI